VKKHLAAVALIIAALAALLPFASNNPDGLEKLLSSSGAKQQHEPLWNGLMSDYTVAAVGNSYLSTFLAGLFGTLMILSVTFALASSNTPKKKEAKRA
jgi:ABC-type sulfate transport system permease component